MKPLARFHWGLIAYFFLCSLVFLGNLVLYRGQELRNGAEYRSVSTDNTPAAVRYSFVVPDCETDRILKVQWPYLSGRDVEELQERLRTLQFYKGPIDGVYGPSTAEAVKQFQRWKGLHEDGIVKPSTWLNMAEDPAPVTPGNHNRPLGDIRLQIDVNTRTLTVFSNDKIHKRYPVAVGTWHTPTPVGEFVIEQKAYSPGGPFGARWMKMSIPWGSYGIHGTNRPWSIGTYASAGCVRMYDRDVEELFEWVPIGTPVTIVGRPHQARIARQLKRGHIGEDVQYLQYLLRKRGFQTGNLDGIYDREMELAVMEFQRYYGLPVTGSLGQNEYLALGLWQ